MKKLFLTLIAIPVFITALFAQNVPNGGFEEWGIGEVGAWEPVNWVSMNLDEFTNVWQVPGRTGESAVRMSVEWHDAFQAYMSSWLFCHGNFPISERFTKLACYYKGTSVEDDSLAIDVGIFKGETMIGQGFGGTTISSDDWREFNVSIGYATGEVPDQAFIAILIPASGGVHYGTEFTIDDLELVMSTGISGPAHSDPFQLTISPNPCRENAQITVTLTDPTFLTLTIMDVQGRVISVLAREEFDAGKQRIEACLNDLGPGIYYCRLADDQGTATMKKIVVMR